MDTASTPAGDSFPYVHPEPPPEYPELPEGVERRDAWPRWRPWSAWVALLAGFAGALFGALVIGVVASAFGSDFTNPPPAANIAGTIVQDLCLIGAALLFARAVAVPRPRQFGLQPTRVWPAIGWMLLAWGAFYAFTLAWVAVLGLHAKQEKLPEELGANDSTVAMLAVAFLVAFVAPIAEELFFRGYFFAALRNWRGTWPAALITGAVFGTIHAGGSDPAFLVPLGFFGFALCLLRVRTGSLYPCIVLHCANNSLALGVSQHWTWQVPALFASALALIGLCALGVRRWWQPTARAAGAAVAGG
jgi:membrane protease YdiL (CAAX protease family)